MSFDMMARCNRGLPEPTPRWTGFPTYNFVGGHNDPTRIPVEALAEAAGKVLRREGSKLAMYNLAQGPQGYLGLREFVTDKLGRHRGISCAAEDVLITTGSGQGIDIVNKLLLAPGDTVILEQHSYGGAISKLKKQGVNIIGAPLDDDGIEIASLAALLDRLGGEKVVPKYIYTIPTIQNPTGSIMPLGRRQGLIALSRRFGVPIFEDECYADLLWAGQSAPPALYALAPGQVIHIGSFSKTLGPALRVGYAVAEWPVLSQMISLKGDSGTGAIDQMIVAEYFSAAFEPHVRALSEVLREKLETMVEAVEREFGTAAELYRPKGGIYLWMKLPDRVDVRTLLQPAAEAGIAFNPGPEWSCDGDGARSHLRLCFAYPNKEEIRQGVAALARVCFEETGIPQRSDNVVNQ